MSFLTMGHLKRMGITHRLNAWNRRIRVAFPQITSSSTCVPEVCQTWNRRSETSNRVWYARLSATHVRFPLGRTSTHVSNESSWWAENRSFFVLARDPPLTPKKGCETQNGDFRAEEFSSHASNVSRIYQRMNLLLSGTKRHPSKTTFGSDLK